MGAPTDISLAVADACRTQGLRPADVRQIVVGTLQSSISIDPIRHQLPNLRGIGTFGYDTAESRNEDFFFCYSSVVRWLLGQRATLNRTLFVDYGLERGSCLQRVLEDLTWGQGAAFELECHSTPLACSDYAWCFAWAQASLADSPLLSLRVCRGLNAHESKPSPHLARKMMQAWFALENPKQALLTLPGCELPQDKANDIERDLIQAMSELSERQQTCLSANLKHLRNEFPRLAEALAQADSAQADVAWIPGLPVLLDASNAERPFHRIDYPLLLDVTPDAVVALNRPTSPRPYYESLRTAGDVMTSHACIGDLTRIDATRNVLSNRLRSNVPDRSQWIYGIIPSLPRFRRLLEVEDMRPFLTSSQVDLTWGPTAIDRFVAGLLEHPGRPLPTLHYAVDRHLLGEIHSVANRRRFEADLHTTRVHSMYQSDRSHRTLTKLENGSPLVIWSCGSIHTTGLQYTARALGRGFEALGHRFVLCIEDDPREVSNRLTIHRSLVDNDPDVILLLDHIRPEYGTMLPGTLPCISWVLDELPQLHRWDLVEKLGPLDSVFLWSPGLAESFRQLGYPHTSYLPFATSTISDHRSVNGNDDDEGSVEDRSVAMIMHIPTPTDPPSAPGFVEELCALLTEQVELPSGSKAIAPWVDRLMATRRQNLPGNNLQQLYTLANAVSRRLDRLRVADAVVRARFPLACYGEGWSAIERFASVARGSVTPGAQLARVYRQHTAVLHINTRCNVHPRVLETMAAGGFVLARSDGDYDHSPGGIGHLFEIGREICLFSNMNDLEAKLSQAFNNPQWRKDFIQAGHARVVASHTYAHRAETMLHELKRQLMARSQKHAA